MNIAYLSDIENLMRRFLEQTSSLLDEIKLLLLCFVDDLAASQVAVAPVFSF
jgi:hypothetical protein